jgi:MarR family transcriptional regulator, transcriptional regulator for hemolysin
MPHLEKNYDRSTILFRLSYLTRRWRQILDREIEAAGLTDATWRPLLHLHLLGDGIRQKDLAASVGIEGPSLVRLLDLLLAKGLIERCEDGNDRRAKLLFLSDAGRELVTRIHKTVTAVERELLAPFSDAEIAQLGELVIRLDSGIDDLRRRGKRCR